MCHQGARRGVWATRLWKSVILSRRVSGVSLMTSARSSCCRGKMTTLRAGRAAEYLAESIQGLMVLVEGNLLEMTAVSI